MPAPAAKPPLSEDAAFRRDYAGYLAQRMGPMIHALMALALCAYLLAVVVRGLLGATPNELLWQLIPAPPMLLVVIAARQCREPLTLHPADVAARGIAAGDLVRVFNDRGACLAGAVLSTRVRPGVVRLATGAWYDPYGPMCVHGNPNVLTADVASSQLSQGCTGQHALVEVERYAGNPPPLTVLRPPTIRSRT